MSQDVATDGNDEREARRELLGQLEALLDGPMVALSFVWLGLMVLEFTAGLSRPLEVLSYAIWVLFGLHFLLGFMIAPVKSSYFRHNWLTAFALLLPAFRALRLLRAFRLLRAARASRSLSFVRVLTTLNRGMQAAGSAMGRRGVGYVAALTVIVTLAGAAGMAAFESPAALREGGHEQGSGEGGGLSGYGEALWWTAMIMTTMGSEYWPKTLEGRLLGWLLAVYAFAIFGYLTAMIASLFLGQDARAAKGESATPPNSAEAAALREEITALRSHVVALNRLLGISSIARDQNEDARTRRGS